MGAFFKRLASRFRKRRRLPVPVRERFEHFLTLCRANDDFLRGLAALTERAEGRDVVTMGELMGAADALADHLRTMVAALNRMSGDQYPDLAARLEEIERDVAIEVFKERPIEYGAFVVWPGEPDALRPEVVGGKAAHLASLRGQPRVHVPPFFAVTSYAFHHFMQASGLRERVDEFVRGMGDPDETARQASEAIRAEVLKAALPEDLRQELHRAYRRLAADGHAQVAVRSSALVEDSEVSFAGQFETVLGVGEEGLADAYRRVVASKYRWQALRYARMSGLLDEEVAMPVLVMAMVDPVASGVAFSQTPDRPDAVLVTAVPGLAAAMVEGRAEPDRFLVSRDEPHEVLEAVHAERSRILRCAEPGGIVEVAGDAATVDADIARRAARAALRCEEHFGCPQDIEWALRGDGVLFVVQSRPLEWETREARDIAPDLAGVRVLASGGVRACGGTAAGPVVHLLDVEEPGHVEPGAVLVVPITSPRLAGVVGKAAAILAATGSATGHMATVAREFHVPMLVGIPDLFARVPEGVVVTVDAWDGRVYEGAVASLLDREGDSRGVMDPVRRCLQRFLDRASPLALSDPRSPDFRVSECRSYHDIARFAHQKAMTEMFLVEGLSAEERRGARMLDWKIPLPVLVLDVGGGLRPGAGRRVAVGEVSSVPFAALVEGMTDPRVRWAGPVGFDLKGFMSVVVRSAADDQRYGEPSFAICSREFVHFSSRLAYHFATVASLCGASADQNYVRFVFHGGAAIAERREWRAFFLATVLRYNGFQVHQVGDRVEAVLGKRGPEAVEEALVMLGRLMVSARHLDMMIENRAAAETYAAAFLSGDYGFESLRREPGREGR